jgi:hypothetical protein
MSANSSAKMCAHTRALILIRFFFFAKIQEIGLEQHECANSSAEMFAEVKRVFENKLRFEVWFRIQGLG